MLDIHNMAKYKPFSVQSFKKGHQLKCGIILHEFYVPNHRTHTGWLGYLASPSFAQLCSKWNPDVV